MAIEHLTAPARSRDIPGRGRVTAAGDPERLDVRVIGPGDVVFRVVTHHGAVMVYGSGHVDVSRVRDTLRHRCARSGEIRIANPRTTRLHMSRSPGDRSKSRADQQCRSEAAGFPPWKGGDVTDILSVMASRDETGTILADQRDPWLSIELRHLAALAAIEREGTFGDAALSLGYVQSAISGQVAALERLTGACLVERAHCPGPQKLTPAGQLLLSHFSDILEELDTARERLTTGPVAQVRALRIAIATGMPDGVMSSVLSAVLAEESGLDVGRIDTQGRAELVDALVREAADVALTDLPLAAENVGTAELARQRAVLVVRAGSPLVRQERPPSLEELGGLPLVVWREGQEPSRIEQELSERGIEPNVLIRTDAVDTVQELVAAGVGAAVLPRAATDDDPRLAAIELDYELPVRVSGIAWLRSRSGDPRIRRFVDVACRLRQSLGSEDDGDARSGL